MPIRLTLFGPPLLSRDGQPINMDTRKALAMAAYLAATATAHSRDSLAALLWPESDTRRARSALRRTLSTLKQALGEDHLHVDGETIALPPHPGLTTDLWEFQKALAACQAHNHPVDQPCPLCMTPLTQAVDLYIADFLAGFSLKDSVEFDDWQYFQTESLRRAYVSALDRLVICRRARHEWDLAIDYARRRLAIDTLHEPAHRQLMHLYALADQRAAALQQYRECVGILDLELGVPPLAETTALYQEIQANRIRPETRPPARLTEATPAVSSPGSALLPLVGRAQEWQGIYAAWQAASTGRIVALSGEAGIGKSRLLDELLVSAQSQGAVTALARCFPGEGELAFGTLLEALRPLLATDRGRTRAATLPEWQQSELTRLFPGLLRETLPPSPLDSPGGQARFFLALAELLTALFAGQTPGVLAFDDLHWVDMATLEFLGWFSRRLAHRPLCLVLAWRHGEDAREHTLLQLVQATQRSGQAIHLVLARLLPEDVAGLLHTVMADRGQDDKLAHRLFTETEGIPWLVAEQLAVLADSPAAAHALHVAPATVRDLFASRLATLDGVAAQVLSAAGVIGRSFDVETVQAAAGRSEEEVLLGVERLLQRRLVVEQAGEGPAALPRYDFCHEKLRELVYAETALARRRLLHRRVAESLARQVGRTPGSAAQAAYHHRWAGQESQAARLYAQAGDEARHLFAHQEALSHYHMALALGHDDPVRLNQAIGQLLTLQGDYPGALVALEQAAAVATGAALAQIEAEIGHVYQRQGAWQLAELHIAAGLDALDGIDDADRRAKLIAALSYTAYRRGDVRQAQRLAEEAQGVAHAGAASPTRAEVANLLGLLARSQGDSSQAVRQLEAALITATDLEDPAAEIAARNNLALALADRGQFDAAHAHLLTALSRCTAWGDRHREAALHNNLADLLHRAGQTDRAMVHLKQAVALFAEVGDPGTLPVNPEIWKLSEW